jgi:hypothetical protein
MLTLLAQKLAESHELEMLYRRVDVHEQAQVEARQIECQKVIQHLLERFAQLNRNAEQPSSGPCIDVEGNREEMRGLSDAALLRYGTVLKYICTAEASFQAETHEQLNAKLQLAREEWHRRFGHTPTRDSI